MPCVRRSKSSRAASSRRRRASRPKNRRRNSPSFHSADRLSSRLGESAATGRDAMFLIRTLVKVAVASLIVGTILTHFGITADKLLAETGLTADRVTEYGRQAFNWALPNVILGSLVIVPI